MIHFPDEVFGLIGDVNVSFVINHRAIVEGFVYKKSSMVESDEALRFLVLSASLFIVEEIRDLKVRKDIIKTKRRERV